MEEEKEKPPTPHIVLVSIPALSHQISILEFAKRLLNLHKEHCFHVTCIIPTLPSQNNNASKPFFFDSLPPNVHCIFLPPVNFDDLRNDPSISLEAQISLAVSRSMPSIREALNTLITTTTNNNKNSLVALVVDAIAHEVLHLIPCEFRDYPNLIQIPGCISVHGKNLPNSVQDRSSLAYKLYLQRCKDYFLADGILVNSFMEMEEGAFKALLSQSQEEANPPVYGIGPITQTSGHHQTNNNGWECLKWLDNQPSNSVLYVSFGSGGTLSQEQIKELALGLELSGHRFLWVNVREPNDKAYASYLSNEGADPLSFLPEGFIERTKEKGLILGSWAPQIEVLGHGSVGAFLSHCGWNSVLESVVKGVPMIAWPLFAEQRTNAAMVTDALRVALKPNNDDDNKNNNNDCVVLKEEIADLVKRLMQGSEGEEIRRRMEKLKEAAACAIMEHGSSTITLSKLALIWKSMSN
nr:hydroquinone glucosyltransferase isoform X2 [Arachis hypogaea]